MDTSGSHSQIALQNTIQGANSKNRTPQQETTISVLQDKRAIEIPRKWEIMLGVPQFHTYFVSIQSTRIVNKVIWKEGVRKDLVPHLLADIVFSTYHSAPLDPAYGEVFERGLDPDLLISKKDLRAVERIAAAEYGYLSGLAKDALEVTRILSTSQSFKNPNSGLKRKLEPLILKLDTTLRSLARTQGKGRTQIKTLRGTHLAAILDACRILLPRGKTGKAVTEWSVLAIEKYIERAKPRFPQFANLRSPKWIPEYMHSGSAREGQEP